jgi:hypothetical protein
MMCGAHPPTSNATESSPTLAAHGSQIFVARPPSRASWNIPIRQLRNIPIRQVMSLPKTGVRERPAAAFIRRNSRVADVGTNFLRRALHDRFRSSTEEHTSELPPYSIGFVSLPRRFACRLLRVACAARSAVRARDPTGASGDRVCDPSFDDGGPVRRRLVEGSSDEVTRRSAAIASLVSVTLARTVGDRARNPLNASSSCGPLSSRIARRGRDCVTSHGRT